jgi:hypothetical protein
LSPSDVTGNANAFFGGGNVSLGLSNNAAYGAWAGTTVGFQTAVTPQGLSVAVTVSNDALSPYQLFTVPLPGWLTTALSQARNETNGLHPDLAIAAVAIVALVVVAICVIGYLIYLGVSTARQSAAYNACLTSLQPAVNTCVRGCAQALARGSAASPPVATTCSMTLATSTLAVRAVNAAVQTSTTEVGPTPAQLTTNFSATTTVEANSCAATLTCTINPPPPPPPTCFYYCVDAPFPDDNYWQWSIYSACGGTRGGVCNMNGQNVNGTCEYPSNLFGTCE